MYVIFIDECHLILAEFNYFKYITNECDDISNKKDTLSTSDNISGRDSIVIIKDFGIRK